MQNVEVIKARQQSGRNHVRGRESGCHNFQRLRVAAYCRVSTDDAEQLSSYQSQKQHYQQMIDNNKEWVLVEIYADEAITGTSVKKRDGFQKMINDCMNGDIDMIITKSISRFARNTLDTLQYVRMLKEKNIAVFFEKENLNTLNAESEFMLSLFSSMAQQDVENTSAIVKLGLKMKMQRGELIGFQGCLGYDYHKEDKSISLNEKEAEIVRLIFEMYLQGYGGVTIAREMTRLKKKTKLGNTKWSNSSIIGIIKNEKYKGDLLMGKTFTVDPISKRRIDNMGESDQFYTRNHHEEIVSEEMWEKAKDIRLLRNKNNRGMPNDRREMYTRKFAFSSKLECGFCGTKLTRRSLHCSSKYEKSAWQCCAATKKGKTFCPHCKAVDESTVESAFIEMYGLLANNYDDVMDGVLKNVQEVLEGDPDTKKKAKVEKDIAVLESKKSKLTDMLLDETISKEAYAEKYSELERRLHKVVDLKVDLDDNIKERKNINQRMEELRRALCKNEVLDEFDRVVFDGIVEKVIVGEMDEDGNTKPYKLSFLLKGTGTQTFDPNKSSRKQVS